MRPGCKCSSILDCLALITRVCQSLYSYAELLSYKDSRILAPDQLGQETLLHPVRCAQVVPNALDVAYAQQTALGQQLELLLTTLLCCMVTMAEGLSNSLPEPVVPARHPSAATDSISVSLEDAAALVSVAESGSVGGKLLARTVVAAEEQATAPAIHALHGHGFKGSAHAVGADASSRMPHAPALQDVVSTAHTSLLQPVIQQPEQIITVIGSLDISSTHSAVPAAHANPRGSRPARESPTEQHITWDPAAAFLPGTSDDSTINNYSCLNLSASAYASTADLLQPVGLVSTLPPPVQQQQQQRLQQLPMQNLRQTSSMRLSNSCGSLSALDAATVSPSMCVARSRLGRPTNPAGNSSGPAAAPGLQDITPAAPDSLLGGAQGNRGPEPGIRTRSVAGGVGDEHSGAGQWHSSNWALQRSASNCSLGSDAGTARRLRIHCVTFNMGSKVPGSLPSGLLGAPQGSSSGGSLSIPSAAAEAEVDLYVFATQESGSISEWEHLISSSLPAGAGYERLAWQTLRAIHLVMYASPRFRKQVLAVKGSAVATGIGNVVGNKGAAALSIQLVDMKLLFVGSHFAAHDDKVDRRNADYARIKAGLFTSHSYSSLADLAGSSSSNLSELSNPHSTHSSPILFSSILRTTPRQGTRSGSPTLGGQHKPMQEQQQSEHSLRDRSTALASPRGWLSELWRPCITPVAATASSNGAPDAPGLLLHSDMHRGSKSARRAQGGATDAFTEMSMLRAASCPSIPGAGSSSLQLIDQHQEPGQNKQYCSMISSHPVREDSLSGSSQTTACINSQLDGCLATPVSPMSLMPIDGVRRQISFFDTFDPVSKQNRDLPAQGSRSLTSSGDIMVDHDVVFWVGDLNYRINGNPKAVGYLLQRELHEVLHANDQLRLQQKKGRVFQGFHEGKIHFPPTFKYTPGTCDYSEQRVPSWTDRILWRLRPREPWEDKIAPTVVQIYYTSVPEVVTSDHKPVVAGFDLAMAPAEVPSIQADNKGLGNKCIIM